MTTAFKPVSALQRGLAVLSVVSKLGHARVTDVHDATGLDKATIIRMLETLVREGYVEKHPLDGTYVVTGRTVDLGRGVGPHARLGELTGPLMEQFRKRIGWPSDFAVPDGDAMFIIETGEGSPLIMTHRPPGYRPDFLVSSLGRAYLAFCAEDEQRRVLDRISGNTVPEAEKLLRDMRRTRDLFEKIRKQGYATTDDAYSKRLGAETILSVAVPLTDKHRVYGAVCLLFVRTSVSEENAARDYLPKLQAFSRRLTKQLERERAGLPGAALFSAD
jgi:IclR family transcriptional regulator, mhp operon transcriptional activator